MIARCTASELDLIDAAWRDFCTLTNAVAAVAPTPGVDSRGTTSPRSSTGDSALALQARCVAQLRNAAATRALPAESDVDAALAAVTAAVDADTPAIARYLPLLVTAIPPRRLGAFLVSVVAESAVAAMATVHSTPTHEPTTALPEDDDVALTRCISGGEPDGHVAGQQQAWDTFTRRQQHRRDAIAAIRQHSQLLKSLVVDAVHLLLDARDGEDVADGAAHVVTTAAVAALRCAAARTTGAALGGELDDDDDDDDASRTELWASRVAVHLAVTVIATCRALPAAAAAACGEALDSAEMEHWVRRAAARIEPASAYLLAVALQRAHDTTTASRDP